MYDRQELKVGDCVERWGFNFTPPTLWERILWSPRWWWNDFLYWVRKQGQRLRYGFPSEESFDFYSHCSKWSLPRLKQLRENLNGYPVCFLDELDEPNSVNQYFFTFVDQVTVKPTPHERWKLILDKIIWSMEHYEDLVEPIYPVGYDHRQIVTEKGENGITFKLTDERSIDWSPCNEHNKRVQEGFDLFGRYFLSLWD